MAKLALSPSSAAKISNLIQQQNTFPIMNGRPANLSGLPIQLYHPVFSIVQEAMYSPDVDLSADDYATTHTLFTQSAALYAKEEKREEGVIPLLKEMLGVTLLRIANANNTRPDFSYVVGCDGLLSALAGLVEIKNEIGTGGCDPAIQAGFSYREFWSADEVCKCLAPSRVILIPTLYSQQIKLRESCCCPTIILAIAGPWLCVLGAIWTSSICVQPLTDYIYIGGGGLECTDKLHSVTKLLVALRQGLSELASYYQHLQIRKTTDRFFPYVHSWMAESEVNFRYTGRLLDDNSNKAIFLAETENRQRIVIKFVRQYHPEAHHHLASLCLAPTLLHFGPVTTHLPRLFMVVMDFVSGKTAQDLYTGRLPVAVYGQVERAVKELHQRRLVFADLRKPNIMVSSDVNPVQVMLVDFDWCGKDEEGRYPPTLNDNANEIKWHPDVKRNGFLSIDHDTWMLGKL
jgi:hypothetical protein